MTSERLRTIWPQFVSAAYLGIVRVYPRSGIRPPINVAGAKHDFCESRKPRAHTCRLGANDVLDGVTCGTGDDSSARIRLNGGREKSERERGFARRGEHLKSERTR